MPELNRRQFAQDPMFDPGERDDPAAAQAGKDARYASRFGDLRVELYHPSAEGVLETGDIRNQFETDVSGGFYDPGYRSKVEREGMGYDDHPVYGYLATQPGNRSDYGNIVMTMKPSVKDRSTIYSDDSWYAFEEHEYAAKTAAEDGNPPPSPLTQPKPFLDGVPLKGPYDTPEAHIHAGEDESRRSMGEYEVLPRSRVPLDDVARADFHLLRERGPDDPMGDVVQRERETMIGLGQQFSERGMNVDIIEEEHVTQDPLPFPSGVGAQLDPNLAPSETTRRERRTPMSRYQSRG